MHLVFDCVSLKVFTFWLSLGFQLRFVTQKRKNDNNCSVSKVYVTEDYDYVKRYLREMAPLENSSSIQDWSTGGKVFLDYITMVETIDEIKQVNLRLNCS